jgi:hypothetical protein
MDSHLSKDGFCELVVRSNGHVEDAKEPWECLELSSSLESSETAVNRWEETIVQTSTAWLAVKFFHSGVV